MLIQLCYAWRARVPKPVPPRQKGVRGFTLLELLVSTAIITMLLSFVAAELGVARVRQRDAEREQEIKSLQGALALYATAHQRYPPADPNLLPYASAPLVGSDPISQDLIQSAAISGIPIDPVNAGEHQYRYESTDGNAYEITYSLETESIPGKSAARNPQRARP